MCDYSIGVSVRRREAREGDRLVSHQFNHRHGSVGCVFPGKTGTAVCMLPGTKLYIEHAPEDLRRKHSLPLSFEAIFAQRRVHDASPEMHRDGVLVKNLDGKTVMFLLKELGGGVYVKVNSTPADKKHGNTRFVEIEMERLNGGHVQMDYPVDTSIRKNTRELSSVE